VRFDTTTISVQIISCDMGHILWVLSNPTISPRFKPQLPVSSSSTCRPVRLYTRIQHTVNELNMLFTALHGMQTRSSDENSVRPFVRLSVTRVNCDKTVKRSVQIYIPYERTFSLVFWEEEWLVESNPFYLKFGVNRPPLERNRRFKPIIARSASAVTSSEEKFN